MSWVLVNAIFLNFEIVFLVQKLVITIKKCSYTCIRHLSPVPVSLFYRSLNLSLEDIIFLSFATFFLNTHFGSLVPTFLRR